MYSCGGLCIAVKGHVWLWRTMYSCGGLCIAVEGMYRRRKLFIAVKGRA